MTGFWVVGPGVDRWIPCGETVAAAEAADWDAWIQVGVAMPLTFGAQHSWFVYWVNAEQQVIAVAERLPNTIGSLRRRAILLVWTRTPWPWTVGDTLQLTAQEEEVS